MRRIKSLRVNNIVRGGIEVTGGLSVADMLADKNSPMF